MSATNISWASHSLNYYNWYCTRVSAGCKNCYMFAMREKFNRTDTELQWRAAAMKEYHALKAGDVVFVNSMSDSYHEEAPLEWIQEIHNLAEAKPDVTFLLLTKRISRAVELQHDLNWPNNLWLGTSVENRRTLWRISDLIKTPGNHFVSMEPLLADLMELDNLDNLRNYYEQFKDVRWVIVGGESGIQRRAFDKDWALAIREFCYETGTHFTFKQGSARLPGRDLLLQGELYQTTPFKTAHP